MPKPDLEVNKWQQMINWTDIEQKIFEPHILQKFSNNQLMEAYHFLTIPFTLNQWNALLNLKVKHLK